MVINVFVNRLEQDVMLNILVVKEDNGGYNHWQRHYENLFNQRVIDKHSLLERLALNSDSINDCCIGKKVIYLVVLGDLA